MDVKPIYELRTRMRAAAIAGTNLLAEDFRFKKAAEAIKPLETASPVFAKIGEYVHTLLTQECPTPAQTLLEALTLVDSVLCTLGMVEVDGSAMPLSIQQYEEHIAVNAPYSLLYHLREAVTLSSGNHYAYICDTYDREPEWFEDFRVKSYLVQALGSSSTMFADAAAKWLANQGEAVLPLLKKDFDPKGKREMVRRVQIIETVLEERADSFYIEMLQTAEKEVRQALIYALRYNQENIDLLIGYTKSERGKCKEAAIRALASMESERAYAFFKSKPKSALPYLRTTTTKWSAALIAEWFHATIAALDNALDDEGRDRALRMLVSMESREKIDFLQELLAAFVGKGGEEICACYREALQRRKNNGVGAMPQLNYDLMSPLPHSRYDRMRFFEDSMGMLLFFSLITAADESLEALAMDLYEHSGENTDGSTINPSFLPAAAMAKLLKGENCVTWLQSQAEQKKISLKLCKDTISIVLSYVHWENGGYILRGYYMNYTDDRPEIIEQQLQLSAEKNNAGWLMG